MPPAGTAHRLDEPDALDDAVARARRGDERSFDVLWTALQPPLLRYLRVIASPSLADDLASETWAQVVRDLSRFDGDAAAFRSWLFTVARHRVVDASRYRSRLRRTVRPVTGQGTAASAEAEAHDASATSGVMAVVGALPRRQAEAVALRVIAGLDTAAAAAVAGTSAGALRVNLHRGLQALAADPRLRALEEHL